jgi:hypothetical protein
VLRVSLLICLVLGPGCAEEPDAPEARGERCETHADCGRVSEGERACGYFPLCVTGRCEVSDSDPGGGSRLIPCPARDAATDRDD